MKQQPFEENTFTHSEERYYHWIFRTINAMPILRGGGATYRWVYESIKNGAFVRRHAAKLDIPLLMLIAGEDVIVHTDAMHRVCKKAPECESVVYENAFHEILFETDDIRDDAVEKMIAFIKRHSTEDGE